LKPDCTYALEQKGYTHFELEEYQEAVEAFKTALEYCPKKEDLNYYRGISFFRLGNFEEAVKSFENASELGCQKPDLSYYTGISRFEIREYEKAVEAFDAALNTGAANLELLRKKALALFELGKAEEAVYTVDTLLEHLELAAENFNIKDAEEIGNESKGENEEELKGKSTGKFKGEIPAFGDSQAFEELLEKFAFSLMELGRYEEALLPLGRLIANESAPKAALYGKGTVLMKLGRLEEALEIFSELLSLYPDFEKTWYSRGLILFSLGYYAEALEAFEQAVLKNQKETPGESHREEQIEGSGFKDKLNDAELDDAWTKLGLANSN